MGQITGCRMVPLIAQVIDSTVIDHLRTADTYRLTRSLAQEEPRTVMARFSLTLCSPVVHQLLEQTLTQGQDAPPSHPCHCVLVTACELDQCRWFSDPLLPRRVARKHRPSSRTPDRAAGSARLKSLPTRCARRLPGAR